ncbi:MAG: DUF7594 domain-containing protein [Lentimonas sp.]
MIPLVNSRSRTLSAFLLLLTAVLQVLTAANSPWNSSNRIAISADGNPDADADDVGATAFTLAVLAKAGLQDNLVHYDFNNFLEYKQINSGSNRMWLSARGGQARWGFDASRFHDAANDPDGAVAHLTSEINKSSSSDRLYLVAAGPMELIYRALEAANVNSRQYVTIVSHHDYNEYFKPRLWHRNWNDVKALVPNIGYLRIADQNGSNLNGLKGNNDSNFHWLRDHADSNLNWVYDRVVAGKPDVSDAGMVTWLIGINGNDEKVTIAEMQTWFGAATIPTNGGTATTPAAPAGVAPIVTPPATQSIFQEVNGKIVIEAESVPLTDDWQLLTSDPHDPSPGYSGSGYIRWVPSWINKIDHQHQGVLIYKLRITNPGNYRMALRSSHFGAPERDKWNDCWTVMGLNPVNPYGITRKTYHSISQEQFDAGTKFSWHTTHDNYGTVANTDGHFSAPLYNLSAGDHYFFILGRSGGFRIDKIHFFKEGVSGFKSDSEPVTPILDGDATDPDPPDTDETILNPIHDAYLDYSTRYNDGLLKVEDGRRVAYLKFNVPAIDDTITNVSLRLTASGDPGSGTIRVYQGNSNAWTETTLSTANAPTEGSQLGSHTGSVAVGDEVTFDLGTPLSGAGEYSFILKMDSGGNDIWFSSKEGSFAPELVITTESADPPVNTVDNSLLPTTLVSAASFSVDVGYEAVTSRDIVVQFWGPSGWLGNARNTVSAGTGTETLTITLAGGAPAPGSGYIFKVDSRPVGANWDDPDVVQLPDLSVTVVPAILSYEDWATSHGLTGADRIGTADLDLDKQTNEDEYLALTDPNDPNSHFAIETMATVSGTPDQLTITWDAKEDRFYTVSVCYDLAVADFQPVASDIVYPQNSYTVDIDQDECYIMVEVSLP